MSLCIWGVFLTSDLLILGVVILPLGVVAVSNLFDEYYVDQATAGYNSQLQRVAGLPEAGRSLRLSASVQF